VTTSLSGQYRLNLTANDIIVEALELLQAIGDGEAVDGNNYTKAKNSLNMMLKLWEAQGLHLWTDEEYTLFLAKGERVYDFNASSARLVDAESWHSTQLAADALAAATSISVDSVANAAIGKAIGILNASNDLQWTVIERIDGTTLHLKDALTTAASADAYVRMYDTANLGTTTLAANEVATDVTVELTSVAGISADYVIGIIDDTNVVLWTTVNSVDVDNSTVTLNDALTGNSASGNAVIFYSSEQNFIPISRIPDTNAMRRHSGEASDYEIPINLCSRYDYMQLPNKTQQGTPIQAFFARHEPNGKLYVWNAPSTAVEYLNFTAERQLQLIVDSTDTFDLPEEWYLALSYNLADLLIPKIGCSPERKMEIKNGATEFLDSVLSFDSDIYGLQMVPEQDHG